MTSTNVDLITSPLDIAGGPLPGQMTTSGNDVGTKRMALRRMEDAGELPDDLLGGTRQMRKRAGEWLPMEPNETQDEYRARLGRAVLTNFYGDTLGELVGLPFSREIQVEGMDGEAEDSTGVPWLDEIIRNADGEGRSLTVFARDQMRKSIHRGMSLILVDVPPATEIASDNTYATQLERQPLFRMVDPFDLYGAETVMVGGKVAIKSVRIHSRETVPDGTYGEKDVDMILEIRASGQKGVDGSVVWWQQSRPGDPWSRVPGRGGPYTQPYITIVPWYCEQVGVLESTPAMENLAWINLAHWQSDSDQKSLLSIARLVTLVTTGMMPEPQDPSAATQNKIVLGPRRRINIPDAQGKASFLEITGPGIEAGFKDLERIEEAAERFGASMVVSRTAGVTATANIADDVRDTSNLLAFITRLENALDQSLQFAADWMVAAKPAVRFRIFREFGLSSQAAQNLVAIQAARAAGDLPRLTYLQELQRNGALAAYRDVNEIDQAAQQEKDDAMAQNMALADKQMAQAGGVPADNAVPAGT